MSMNGMRVYDPYANVTRSIDEITTARAVGDYVPVRSLVEGKWFALYLPSNNSHRLSDLSGELRGLLEREANTHELCAVLLERCEALDGGLFESVELSEQELADARMSMLDDYGATAYKSARVKARSRGYTPETIDRAMALLTREPTLEEIREGVEAVDIRSLAEGA